MGIRETLNQKPGVVGAVVLVAVVVLVVIIVYQIKGPKPAGYTDQGWFTTDDGQTWFADDSNKPVPFEKDGKPAVQAYVYQCGSGKPFVGLLRRFTPDAIKIIEEARKAGRTPSLSEAVLGRENVEVKKPGDQQWLKLSESRDVVVKAMAIRCPDGTRATDRVYP